MDSLAGTIIPEPLKHCRWRKLYLLPGRSSWCGRTPRGAYPDAHRYAPRNSPAGLKHIGGKTLGAVTVKIVQGRGEGRYGYPVDQCGGHYPSPSLLGSLHLLLKEGIQQQVGQCRVTVKGFLDLTQEYGTDNTSSPPEQGQCCRNSDPSRILWQLPA